MLFHSPAASTTLKSLPSNQAGNPQQTDRPCLGERVSLGVTGETPLPTDAQGREGKRRGGEERTRVGRKEGRGREELSGAGKEGEKEREGEQTRGVGAEQGGAEAGNN